LSEGGRRDRWGEELPDGQVEEGGIMQLKKKKIAQGGG